MSAKEPEVGDAPGEQTAVRAPQSEAYEPLDAQDEWPQDELEELPARPRRRLLAPFPLALLGVVLIACGFIVGVLVEKGQGSSGSSTGGAAGLASRLGALRRGAASGAGAAGAGGFGAGVGATVGSVAYLSGDTLYVTTSEGNTVKVTTSPATTVTKTVAADIKGIHPGETVTVTGAAGTDGAVTAESIRVGAGGGGLGALFSGFGSGGGSRSGSSGSGGSSSGGQALFGNGG